MISIDHLRTLSVFVRTGSMAAAARALGISQPAVSLQLKMLEQTCRQPLFYQSGGKKHLTPLGYRLHDLANGPLMDIEQKVNEALVHPSAIKKVRIAGRDDVLEKTILSVRESFPGPVELIPCSSEVAAKMVLEHEVDFAITYHVPQSHDLIAKKLFNSTPSIAWSIKSSPQVPSKGLKNLTPEVIQRYPWLVYKKDDPTMTQICKHYGIDPTSLNFGLIAPSWSLLRQSAERGVGIAILPSIFAENNPKLEVLHKFAPGNDANFSYYLLYTRESAKRKIVQSWIRSILLT